MSNDEPAAISTSKVIDRSISRSALGNNGLTIFIKENYSIQLQFQEIIMFKEKTDVLIFIELSMGKKVAKHKSESGLKKNLK